MWTASDVNFGRMFYLPLVIVVSLVSLSSSLRPIVMVPGLGGTQLEARLNRTSVPHWYCYRVSDWFTLWLSVLELEAADCMVDNMRLFYVAENHTTRNNHGVEIRVDRFGSTETIEWLDPFHTVGRSHFAYFTNIVESLIKAGYHRNVSVRGVPFDFRKAPNEMDSLFKQMTKLVEETYELNNKTRIILMGHSMGNNFILYWLNRQPQWWKDLYIDSLISLAAPWAGSVKTLRLMASGDSLGQSEHVIKPIQARPLEQSMPSTAYLMPGPYWHKDEVLVMSPKRNFTNLDYEAFFESINHTDGFLMWKDTESLTKDLVDPNVKVHCIYGLMKVDITPAVLDYRKVKSKNWYDEQPVTIYGPGDGTVNERSLKACNKWSNVEIKQLDDAEHLSILLDPRTMEIIFNIISR
ncbi:hypothetical protein HELRODRAFT_159443 [Helobdella robusta]|uniref:Group XV phospholipase A2 n=1 Tax=Helobdella robusta TaxID=6412 RepID=T1EP15_HELRO|nr:hypothetical protein HELRODRAFT_159443 [Helobdella robusta]ESO12856.1 hypothetical protein HELRODRAFT_159443 [Helobdella robusta]